jgi:glutathione S-transferase
MLKIWGRISSINVRKAVWAAQECGVPFERVDAGAAFGMVKTPVFLAKNPNGLIPMMEEEDEQKGFVLWESNAIVRYLCASYAPDRLYPQALHARFDAERWMDWQQTTFNPAGRGAFMQLIRTAPEHRQQAVIDQSVAATEALLAMLDAHLSQRAFMGGDQFTMADIPLGCELHRWCGLTLPQASLTSYAHVKRWYQQLVARPAARGVLDVVLS